MSANRVDSNRLVITRFIKTQSSYLKFSGDFVDRVYSALVRESSKSLRVKSIRVNSSRFGTTHLI